VTPKFKVVTEIYSRLDISITKVMGIVLIIKWLFVTTIISRGSVATRLRCGGQCVSQFVANFVMNSTMEKFRKSVNICQGYGQKYRGPFFDSQCIYTGWPKKRPEICVTMMTRILHGGMPHYDVRRVKNRIM